MELYVGTSGWLYSWNEGRSLDWYVASSGLNAVELNASFYRFPYPNQVKHWASIGKDLAWSIKVNRLITHQYKLSKNSYGTLKKFFNLFSPLEKSISYYLFQLPPSVTPNIIGNVEDLLKHFPIKEKFALEARSDAWLNEEVYKKLSEIGVTFVSIDAPFAKVIKKTSDNIYLRLHGRKSWYSYNYSEKELAEVLSMIKGEKPRKAFVFFNNNHDMLSNARKMLELAK
ncbi:MAG: DUF72 domain-containing protein [Candidatus Micrarchaeia archaeon]